MMKNIFLLACAAAIGLAGPSVGLAEDTPTVARAWHITPKAGMEDELEEALKAHSEFRSENGDPWAWNFYHAMSGPADGSWIVRSPGHTWAEIDDYPGSEELSDTLFGHFQRTVSEYVESSSSGFAEYLPGLSNWPEDDDDFEYYWVSSYHVKPGHGRAFREAAQAIVDALKDNDWDEHWAFTRSMTGNPNEYNLVGPEASLAAFAGPDQSAYELVAEEMGEDKAADMWAAMFEHVASVESHIYHRHEDMSYDSDD